MLELAFSTKELRSACEDAAYAYETYGPIIARALIDRLADLRATSHLRELPFAEFRSPADGAPERIVISLAEGRKLVIGANHKKLPLTPDGSIAWEHVSRIMILELE